MSLFNTIAVKAKCPWCGKISPTEVQFKYGKLWQYRYNIGDTLIWPSENRKIKKGKVVIAGVAIPCRYCVKDFIDFEIIIEDNIIKSVTPLIPKSK